MSTVKRAVFKFCEELASVAAGSGCVRGRVVVGGLGGFTGGDVEIDNWMFCEVLVGDRGRVGVGVMVFCKLEEPGVRVVIGFDFEGFCLAGRFLKL